MCYKIGIFMKRSTKLFWLASFILFSNRLIYSQPPAVDQVATMPNLMPIPAAPQVGGMSAVPVSMPSALPTPAPTLAAPDLMPAAVPAPAPVYVPMPAPQPIPVTQPAAVPDVAPDSVPNISAPQPIAATPASIPDISAPQNLQASNIPSQQASNIPSQIVEPNNFLHPQDANTISLGGASAFGPTSNIQSNLNSSSDESDGKKSDEKDIYLNFDNADLSNFVNYIAEIRHMNLVVDKSIESTKISLTIREPLTADGAWNVFLTVLEMAGFSIIKIPGDLKSEPLIFKVIPKDQKLTQPLPAYINISPELLPNNDINIRYVLFLTNMTVDSLHELLASMLSDKSNIVDVKDVNGFVITDKSLNVKAAVKVLLELDQMGTAEAVTVIKLKNANAVDVKTLLDGLIKGPEVSPLQRLLGKTAEGTTSYFPPGTRIIAEERTNSLILLGNPKPIKKIEEFIVKHIDTELGKAKSPLHVYELQNTDATQIAAILQEVTAPPDSPAGQNATKYGAIRGGVKYFKNMIFKVDKDGNRLVVSSTDKADWKLLKKTIKDLDKPQPQVAIESMIVMIDVTDNKGLGGGIRNKKHGMLGINIDAQSASSAPSPSLETIPPDQTSGTPISLLGDMINQISPQIGLATLTFGSPSNIWGYLQALKSLSNTTVLSQPFITIANKTAAHVLVGQEYRLPQEIQGAAAGGLTGYEPVDANTDLTITPQINLDGLVRLDIDLKIDTFINPAVGSKTNRNLKTNVAVANGQVLALGGFVSTNVSETTSKTPILGDIPLLGWMFKWQQRTIIKSYIFIFLCPTIIKPRQTPGMNLYTKMKLHEATDSIEDGITTKRTPDPVHNWFFNPDKENYSHKVIDFANARYQPTTVDIKDDPYYRARTVLEETEAEKRGNGDDDQDVEVQDTQGAKKDIEKGESLTSTPPAIQQEQKSILMPVYEQAQKNEQVKTVQNMPVEPGQMATQSIQSVPVMPVQEPAQPVQPATTQVQMPLQVQSQVPANEAMIKSEVEPEKREEFKNFISQEPTPVKTEVSAQVQQVDFEPEPNREELKRLISPEPKVVANRPAKFNFDVIKRNRLKDFLSKNPALSKRRDNGVKNKKEALA
jgi:general secretion pathway protein D